MDKPIRLDKLLCDMGLGTRSEIKKMIAKGKVIVDDEIVRDNDRKVEPQQSTIIFNGTPIRYAYTEYIMMNKPQGVISATEDSRQKTVLDLLSDAGFRKDLCIVGRLDIDTEGLLFLTNDGALNHALLSPKHHVDKQYEVFLDRPVPENTAELFYNGIEIDDEDGKFTALSADLDMLEADHALLTIREGKFHQVKRMFQAVGCKVTFLKRLSMGPLRLDPELKPGEYRELTTEEIRSLKETEGD